MIIERISKCLKTKDDRYQSIRTHRMKFRDTAIDFLKNRACREAGFIL